MLSLTTAGRLALAAPAGLVEVLLPEQCADCGAAGGHAAWEHAGPCVPGLRPWDRPHLCRDCSLRLFADPCARLLPAPGDEPPLPAWAATASSARLTRVVGAWKYHGVRGLGWPLGRALAAAARAVPPPPAADAALPDAPHHSAVAAGDVLVPVPLHASRRRARGFNQSDMLAALAGVALGLPVAQQALVRTRATAQQARLTDGASRRLNLAGAFAARPATGPRRALVVDDLVTAGATAQAAAAALRAAGWEVAGVLSLGLALARDDDNNLAIDFPEA